MTNLFSPEQDAVNRSPVPELSTTNPAKEVEPDTEATGNVPFSPLTSKVAREGTVPTPRKLFTVVVPDAFPNTTFPVPVVAIFTFEAPVVPRLVVPVDVNVVNTPLDAVVAPIAVLLIPVAVVLKCPDVISKSFPPVEILDALNPDSVNVPEVAVKFNAPVVCVNPFEAVNNPFDVIVPPDLLIYSLTYSAFHFH